jgi:hypothetical protein
MRNATKAITALFFLSLAALVTASAPAAPAQPAVLLAATSAVVPAAAPLPVPTFDSRAPSPAGPVFWGIPCTDEACAAFCGGGGGRVYACSNGHAICWCYP